MRRLWMTLLAGTAMLLGCLAPAGAAGAAPRPFRGTALWIDQVPAQVAPQTLAQQARADGVQGLYVKAGDGDSVDPQFTPALVQELEAGGVSVCAWTFVYGADPRGEAAVAVAAARAGAQCLIIDAEGAYDGHYQAAQLFVRLLRAQLGAHYPIALAGQAEVQEHPGFPYSVFLGPGAFDVDMPQIYWRDFNVSVDRAFAATVGSNVIYKRPILPVGQLYGSPSAAAVQRFRSLSAAYGFPGLSFYDLDQAQPAGLAALTGPARVIPRRALVPQKLAINADGDEVVWAQELLDAGGAHLPVGGYYGNLTARAVAHFQSQRHLAPNGTLDPATWKLLLRLTPETQRWAHGAPDSAHGG